MSRILVVTSALLALASAPRAADADTKLAYVDKQVVLSSIEDGKKAKERMKKWIDARQAVIDREAAALRKERDQLAAAQMPPKEAAEKQRDLERRMAELQQKLERMREEAARQEQKELAPIAQKIDAAIAKAAEKHGIDFVFDRGAGGLVYARAKHDLTREVISAYATLR